MKIGSREVAGVTVLDLRGKFILGEPSQKVRTWLHQSLEQGSRWILLNLDGVNFIDSTGLGVLSEACNAVTRAGGVLKISGASTQVDELLFITQLGTVVDCFEDEGTALASFG